MTEATSLVIENFLEVLKTVAWCKQGETVLVAVHKCVPEVIVALADREARVHPGNTPIKLNKSWLNQLQEFNGEGNPAPILMAWKPGSLEIWYRRHKTHEFPYDVWQNPVAEAYERECVKILSSVAGPKFAEYHQEMLEKSKACPSLIPPM